MLLIGAPPVAAAIVSHLRIEGFEVVGVADARTARRRVRALGPDVIVLDVERNRGGGWELLSDLRAEHPALPIGVWCPCPVSRGRLARTALGRAGDGDRIIDVYIAKPRRTLERVDPLTTGGPRKSRLLRRGTDVEAPLGRPEKPSPRARCTRPRRQPPAWPPSSRHRRLGGASVQIRELCGRRVRGSPGTTQLRERDSRRASRRRRRSPAHHLQGGEDALGAGAGGL